MWLAVGVIVATRITFFDKRYTEESIARRRKRIKSRDGDPDLAENKLFGFLGITFLGLFSFYLDTKYTFRGRDDEKN